MLSNMKVLLGPTVGLHCKSQRLSMPHAELSNVCHTLLQIKLWWLKIWAGESQRSKRESCEALVDSQLQRSGWKAPCYQSEVSLG